MRPVHSSCFLVCVCVCCISGLALDIFLWDTQYKNIVVLYCYQNYVLCFFVRLWQFDWDPDLAIAYRFQYSTLLHWAAPVESTVTAILSSLHTRHYLILRFLKPLTHPLYVPGSPAATAPARPWWRTTSATWWRPAETTTARGSPAACTDAPPLLCSGPKTTQSADVTFNNVTLKPRLYGYEGHLVWPWSWYCC